MDSSIIFKILLLAPPLLVAVVLHEVAHGIAAEKLGDTTARKLGRITLNPIKHIDPFMTIALPAMLIFSGSPVIFGGAKPVPVNPMVFKNPRRGMAYVALAGPVSNFILASICAVLLHLLAILLPSGLSTNLITLLIVGWLVQGLIINLILGCFNLLPVPPLDGGRIAVGFLPLNAAKLWAKLEPFGILVVFALLYSGFVDSLILPVIEFAEKIISL